MSLLSVYTFQKSILYSEDLYNFVKAEMPNLVHVVVKDDNNVDLSFPDPLDNTQQSQLVYLINSYSNPITPPIHTKIHDSYTVSDKPGADFNNLEEAVSFAKLNISTTPVTITVYPGTYVLTQTLELVSGLNLVSSGSQTITILQYAAQDEAIVSMTGTCYFEGFTIRGQRGLNMTGISHDGSGFGSAVVYRCQIEGVETGVVTVNGPNPLQVIFSGIGGLFTKHVSHGAKALNGGNLLLNQGSVTGITEMCDVGVSVIGTDGLGNPSILSCSVYVIYNALKGFLIDGGRVEVRAAEIAGCVRGGEFISTQRTLLNDVTFHDNYLWDIDVQLTPATVPSTFSVNGCIIDRDKINNPNLVPLLWQFVSPVKNQAKHVLTGTVNMGDHITPTKLVVGRGEANYHEMAVITNTNGTTGTWYNQIENVKTLTTFDVWPTLSLGACLYIGHVSSTFSGLSVNLVQSNASLGPSNIWEYWNGTTWVTTYIMTIEKSDQFTNTNNMVFQNPPGKYYVFFGKTTGWATLQLNDLPIMYWIRCRIVDPNTTLTRIKEIIPILDSKVIEGSGFTMRFGKARTVRLHSFVSTNSWLRQVFRDLLSDFYSTTTIIPAEMDISYPVRLVWAWHVSQTLIPITTSKKVVWQITWSHIPTGTTLTLDADDWFTTANDQTMQLTTTIQANQIDTQVETYVDLYINNCHPGNDTFAFKLKRLGTNINDTLATDVHLVNCYMKYLTFIDGTPINEMD